MDKSKLQERKAYVYSGDQTAIITIPSGPVISAGISIGFPFLQKDTSHSDRRISFLLLSVVISSVAPEMRRFLSNCTVVWKYLCFSTDVCDSIRCSKDPSCFPTVNSASVFVRVCFSAAFRLCHFLRIWQVYNVWMCKTEIVGLLNNNGEKDANDFHYSLKQWFFFFFWACFFRSHSIFSTFNISKIVLSESGLRNMLK